MINAFPEPTPVTMPVVDPIVATEEVPLVHDPPAGKSLSVIELPRHTVLGPEIGAGSARTTTVAVLVQP